MSVNKKKVFMNTNVSLILNNKDKFIDNLRRIFDIFKRRGRCVCNMERASFDGGNLKIHEAGNQRCLL